MNYNENFIIGMQGLRSHLLRTFLSMLGIIFGVGAVIAMLSIGEGAKQQALEQIQLMGMRNIIVQDVPYIDETQQERRDNKSQGLTWADARAVRELNPIVTTTVPMRELSLSVRYGSQQSKVAVVGTTPEYSQVMNYDTTDGTFLNYDDVMNERRVCTLGHELNRELFFFQNAVGEQIKISDQWYTVIGVMADKPVSASRESNIAASDMNHNVYIPITTMLKRYTRRVNESEINRFIAQVTSVERIQEAANILNSTIQRRHNKVDDFRITVPEALLRQSQQTQRIFNIVMGAIAGISLLVGGIGIMNIMLASILERTREIGIRRATGATRRDILGQFLTEAILLSFVCGIIGIVMGFVLTRVIAFYADWRTIVSWEAILLAFTVSVGVGIIFGVYPARRAARMDPIDALRYE